MMTFSGAKVRYTIFGGSHESAIGVTADGLPAGEPVDLDALQAFLQRRAPGRNAWSTPRKEADAPEFSSGITDGMLDGSTLHALIRNTNTRSQDYRSTIDVPRPSHADFTAQMKFHGTVNMAGGGPFSGRMTAPLCILGGICLQILARRGITVGAHIVQIGSITAPGFDPVGVTAAQATAAQTRDFPVTDDAAADAMCAEIESARQANDSVGGVVECAVVGLPAGLGGPMTDGLESRISAIVFGVPAVRGIEFGAGFSAAAMRGSAHNDAFCVKDGLVRTVTNRHSGILGGISSGMPVVFRTAFKPTPSIGIEQQSVSLSAMTPAPLTIVGRHDPCIVPRAVPVIEAAAAIAIVDAMAESGMI